MNPRGWSLTLHCARRLARARPRLRTRIARALAILRADGVRLAGSDHTYSVHSQRGPGAYRVDLATRTCTCPDHRKRNAPDGWCKHLIAAAIYHTLNQYAAQAA